MLLFNIFLISLNLEKNTFYNFSEVLQVPSNFTGYYYASGYINLTWVSGFDGGKEQVFIVSKQYGLKLAEVTNLSDPGQGKIVFLV